MNKELRSFVKGLEEKDKEKFIKMMWEDCVSYKDINKIFNLAPAQAQSVARSLMDEKSYKRWLLRQEKRSTKKGRNQQECE